MHTIYIYFMRRSQNKTYEYRDVIDIVVIAISIIFGITMFVMVIQNIYLISTGKTTNEFIRNRYNEKIFSAYAIFGKQLKKFKYQGGVRIEKAYQIPNNIIVKV